MRHFWVGAIFLVMGAIPVQAQIIQLSCDIPCGDCPARGKLEISINESLGTATVYYPVVGSGANYQLFPGNNVFRLRRQAQYVNTEIVIDRTTGAAVSTALDINSSKHGSCVKIPNDAKTLF